MPTSTNSLQTDTLEIRRLNRHLVKAVAESNLPSLQEILPKYAETKKRIKTNFLKCRRPKCTTNKPWRSFKNYLNLKEAVTKGSLRLRRQIGDLYSDLSSLIHGRKVASSEEAKAAFESI